VEAHHIALPSPLVSTQVDNSTGYLVWWAFRETSTTASLTLRLWDGTGPNSRLLLPISLINSCSTREWPGNHALPYVSGLFLELVSGTGEGSVQVCSALPGEPYGIPAIIIGEVDVNIATGG